MGFYFRRSVNLGPFRVNVSRGGQGPLWRLPGRRSTRHPGWRCRLQLAVSLRIQRRLASLPSKRRADLWASVIRQTDP